jgi:hypothetical protein
VPPLVSGTGKQEIWKREDKKEKVFASTPRIHITTHPSRQGPQNLYLFSLLQLYTERQFIVYDLLAIKTSVLVWP